MDFNSYYLNQASANNYPVFRGPSVQKGYGLGNAFRRFFSWALPLLKQHALPIAKSIGKEVISNAASIATDAVEGRDLKESAKQKITDSLKKLSGSGIKRKKFNQMNGNKKKKRKTSKKKKTKKNKRKYTKKYNDIFSRDFVNNLESN